MIKILTIVGARPQFIKAAALSRSIRQKYQDKIREVILHTGQHYDASMSDVFFEEMQIPRPDHMLEIGSHSHVVQTGKMIEGIEAILLREKPDALLVYGDTNSTLAGALAAIKIHVPVIHVEAGLRSFNKRMPEEINRIACDHVSTLLFSPTLTGIKNLEREGIQMQNKGPFHADRPGVFHCGDLMYDNTVFFSQLAREKSGIIDALNLNGQDYILATMHRPSNTDNLLHLKNILLAFDHIARERQIPVVLPLHPRTAAVIEKNKADKQLQEEEFSPLLHFIGPVSFLDMLRLELDAKVILTDSGGVQKEAYFCQKPVVVMREETEWVEIISSGNGELTGPSMEKIIAATYRYLDDPPGKYPPIFGGGFAAEEILDVLCKQKWS